MAKLYLAGMVALVALLAACAADPVPGPIQGPVELCVSAGGEWREFPNACADLCGAGEMCAEVLTTSCDCGPGRCWDGEDCIPG